MIIVPTEKQIDEAKRRAAAMGAIRNSITEGAGNMAGFIGEIIVGEYLGAEFKSTKDYDIVYNNYTVDVKTKVTTAPPLPHYMCSIAATSTHQECDWYVFCRWHKYKKVLYVLGCMPREEFFEHAEFFSKGDKEGDNGFTVRADCYSLPISKLYSLEHLTSGVSHALMDALVE
jgi:hypothetical protein